ncbi:MAG: hypothetical protein LAT82_05635 [Nanoarchaeota archaeon]|nr:hypothetical protein [Nanoarchaeota archaeon]
MSEILQEFSSLKKTISSFSLFGRKVQNISKLKKSFFEKILNFEQQENIEQAQQYYSYFIRAEQLSTQIYTNMKQNFQELQIILNQETSITDQEIELISQLIQTQRIQECMQVFSMFHITNEQYTQSIKQFLHAVLVQEDICSKLISLTQREEEDTQDINNASSGFFEKLKDQREIHQLLIQEELVSNQLQVYIKQLINQTTLYSQKIIELSKQLQRQFLSLSQELKTHPQQFIVERFFTPFKQLIEKHSSIIALSAITLGIVANISALAGTGGIAITAKITTDALSYSLKGVEALPSLRNIIEKSNQIINQAVQRSQQMISQI